VIEEDREANSRRYRFAEASIFFLNARLKQLMAEMASGQFHFGFDCHPTPTLSVSGSLQVQMDTDVGLELKTDVDRHLSGFLNLSPIRPVRESCDTDVESGADM
jgi:hypothetical protein